MRRVLPAFLVAAALSGTAHRLDAATLEEDFRSPPAIAKPYVWWHWLGANISKEGITKDLEAMAAAGIGGATIFNITSGVRESQAPIADLPWPERTYRSPYYWECLRHAAAEAKRLGLEIGLHNTVGYSTTGGPWVTEPQAMKKVIWSETAVQGGGTVQTVLARPALTVNGGWGGVHRDPPAYYRDIAVIAVPAGPGPVAPERLVDLTARMDATGALTWTDAPAGTWTVVRLGCGPTGATPHPVPDELIGGVREADKLDPAVTTTHWQTVLQPLREHLGELLGDSFRHVLIDSYEAGHQNWTDGFREEFQARFGYDPVPWLVSRVPMLGAKDLRVIGDADRTARFEYDLRSLVAERYQRDGWERGRDLIHAAGLTLQHEAYGGPFDTVAGSYAADLPMGEFWSHRGGLPAGVVAGARAGGRAVIGAEAFTGLPQASAFSETPRGLQKGTVSAFVDGVNRLILHHWVHQPFADTVVPGLGMGWWGTHFSRHQTWFEGGKAWLAFAGRCQVLLQHGQTWVPVLAVGKAVGDSDAVPVRVFLAGATVDQGEVVLPSGRRYAVVVIPHDGAVLPEVLTKVRDLLAAGATVVAKAPARSPSLAGYPESDGVVRTLAAALWKPGAQPRLFAEVAAALEARGIVPVVTVTSGKVRTLHRHAADADVVLVANLETAPQDATLSLLTDGRQPEIWNPEDGSTAPAAVWREAGRGIDVDLRVPALSARFVVLRTPGQAAHVDQVVSAKARVVATPAGPVLRTDSPAEATITQRGKATSVRLAPVAPAQALDGPWSVTFSGPGTPGTTNPWPSLISWSEHADPAVRYASGTGTYTRTVDIPAAWLAERGRVELDLGDVRDLAVVSCNGTSIVTCWMPPFRVDLTEALHPGPNVLAIAVSNTWSNRLVGDEQEPDDCTWGEVKRFGKDGVGRPLAAFPAWLRTGKPRPSPGRTCFVTWNYVTKDTPLRPAGLLGPVRLLPVAEIPLAR